MARTPEQWLDRLNTSLLLRQTRIRQFDDYYRGTQTLTFASQKFREAFGSLFSKLAVNYCVLIVDAERDRLKVEGFRMGADHSVEADTDAWRIWQGNQLDAFSPTAHVEALVKEEAYALVSPFREEWPADDVPLITLEDPLQSIVEVSAANRRKRLAGLKRWIDDDGNVCANLYLPDAIYKYIQHGRVDTTVQLLTPASILLGEVPAQGWEPRVVEGEAWPLPNPLGVVPMVRLVNRPRLDGTGESELATVLPIQDAINKTVADMLLAAEFAAFRQKWGINIPVETDENGKAKQPFNIAIDKLLAIEPGGADDPEPKLGEFSATDLRPYVAAKEGFIQDLSSITRTPAHYLLGQSGQFPSGESLTATETGLVAKVRLQQLHFGEAWEEVVRLAFRALEDPRGKIEDSETIWRDPESRTESQHVDSLVKMSTLGVPNEILWEKWGASPQEIARWKDMASEQAITQPAPPPNPFTVLPGSARANG